MIYVNDYYASQTRKKNAKLNPITDYVKHFSELQDLFEPEGGENAAGDNSGMVGFAKVLQQKVLTNKIKVDFKHALANKMQGIKTRRELGQGLITEEEVKNKKAPTTSLFNKCLVEENKTISRIADTFVRRNEY